MGTAKAYKFQHNDYEDLEEKLKKYYALKQIIFSIYVVTESVFQWMVIAQILSRF